jgi:hypothetical protein
MAITTQRRRLPSLERILMTPFVWLRRSRGWRRRGLLLLYTFVALSAGLAFWWVLVLNGLPDVGHPFDTAAFIRAGTDARGSQDAAPLYRKAAKEVRVNNEATDFMRVWGIVRGGWAKASPSIRSWVAENRDVLKVWQQATDLPHARLLPLARNRPYGPERLPDLRPLATLAILEGLRQESEGRMPEAWDWYRAVQRAGHHLRESGGYQGHMQADASEDLVHERLVSWAVDPKTRADTLRRALDDLITFDAQSVPISTTLKVEYLGLVRGLEDPDRLMREAEMDNPSGFFYKETRPFQRIYWFLLREPERSRRVVRLVFANWLAYVDRPPGGRPKVVGGAPHLPLRVLYERDASAPAPARALAPTQILAWLDASPLAWRFLIPNEFLMLESDRQRKSRAVLIMTLAEQLYQRQTGRPPTSADELVGTVLKTLPEGYAGERQSGETTTNRPDGATP